MKYQKTIVFVVIVVFALYYIRTILENLMYVLSDPAAALALVVVIAALVLWRFDKGRKATKPGSNAVQENLRKCPFCSEMIQQEAKFCKHCGKEHSSYRPFRTS